MSTRRAALTSTPFLVDNIDGRRADGEAVTEANGPDRVARNRAN